MITDSSFVLCDSSRCDACFRRKFRHFGQFRDSRDLKEHYQENLTIKGYTLPLKKIVLRDTRTCADPVCEFCQGSFDARSYHEGVGKCMSHQRDKHLKYVKSHIDDEKERNFFISEKLKQKHGIIDYCYLNGKKYILCIEDSKYTVKRILEVCD